MAELKLTKNELREQQRRLVQLEQYLPTLQLKKSLLQAVVHERRVLFEAARNLYFESQEKVRKFAPFFTTRSSIHPLDAVRVAKKNVRWENVAGVELPELALLEFEPFSYQLFETPPWIDGAVVELQRMVLAHEKFLLLEQQLDVLEKELREVSIRENLFKKILIPRTTENIQKIRVFLGDQQLAAVARVKVAKAKIEAARQRSSAGGVPCVKI